MSNLFIAVGGTGQHIALACSRLMRLGAIPRDSMDAIIIDADNGQDLSKVLIDFRYMKGSNVISPPLIVRNDARFREIFLNNSPSQAETDIFNCLFSEAEADKDLSKGMYGRPSVAATVFANTGNSNQLGELLPGIQNADKIIIAGSFIGGTGAGITHQLVKFVKDSAPKKEVYGVFLQPWLSLTGGNDEVTNTTLLRNMCHGMEYFTQHTAPQFTRSVLLGVPGEAEPWLALAQPERPGSEVPHVLHLIAGYSCDSLPRLAADGQTGQIYAFGVDEKDSGLFYRSLEFSGKSILHWVHQSQYVQKLLKHLTSDKGLDNINANFGGFGFLRGRNFTTDLGDTIKAHSKKLNKAPKDYFSTMIDSFKDSINKIEQSTTWLSGLLGPIPANPNVVEANEWDHATKMFEKFMSHFTAADNHVLGPENLAQEIETKLRGAFQGGGN